jgi:pimeloyl-ACP methyl ester carboxylesterase
MSKPRLYFIPGTQCDQRVWGKLWPELSQFDLIHLPIPLSTSIDEMATHIAASIEEDHVALIGFSLGGHLAARLAQLFPQKIARLFLMSNSPCALPVVEQQYRAGALKWIAANGYQGIGQRRLRRLIDTANWDRVDIQTCIKTMDRDLGTATLVHQFEVTTDRDQLLEGLAELGIPTTLCFGDSDILIDRTYLENHKTQVALIEVQSCGHMMPLEQAEMAASHIRAWATEL